MLSVRSKSVRKCTCIRTSHHRPSRVARVRCLPPSSGPSDAPLSPPIKEEPSAAPIPSTDAPVPTPPPGSSSGSQADWIVFAGTLVLSGAIDGPLLDGIHSRTGLQIYDVAPLVLGPLQTAATVPPLLAMFYLVLGSLFPLLDSWVGEDSPKTKAACERSSDVAWVALGFGALAAGLELSAWMYRSDYPFWQISVALALVSSLMWRVFDGTKHGLGLAVLCAVGAPVAELVLNSLFGLWHYPQGDILGGAFVSWVPFCYFFYTPVLGTFARFMWQMSKE